MKLVNPVYVQEIPMKAVLTTEEVLRRTSRPLEVPGNLEKAVFTNVEVL